MFVSVLRLTLFTVLHCVGVAAHTRRFAPQVFSIIHAPRAVSRRLHTSWNTHYIVHAQTTRTEHRSSHTDRTVRAHCQDQGKMTQVAIVPSVLYHARARASVGARRVRAFVFPCARRASHIHTRELSTHHARRRSRGAVRRPRAASLPMLREWR